MALIEFPMMYVPNPDKFGTLAFGKIFVGEPDLDPEVPANQKQLRVVQEDGTKVNVPQPFILSAGGLPVYNGESVRLDVDGNYSIKILDSNDAQKYYVQNTLKGAPLTQEDLIGDLSQSYIFDTVAEYKAFPNEFPEGKTVHLNDRDVDFTIVSGTIGGNDKNKIASTQVNQSAELKSISSFVNIKSLGAVGDNTNDDTSTIQFALDNYDVVYMPPANYNITAELTITKSNQTLYGYRGSSVLVMNAIVFPVTPFSAVKTVSGTNLTLRNFKVLGAGSASGVNVAVDLFNSHNTDVLSLTVEDADTIAIALVDCDHASVKGCRVSNSQARFDAGSASFGIELDGSGHCTVSDCHLERVGFGFLVIGDDTASGGTNGHRSQRANSFATSNTVSLCTVKHHSGSAFDINAASNNTFAGNTAAHIKSGNLNASFQNKHSSTDESKNNVFVGNTAKDCSTGFYAQDGSNVQFNSSTVIDFVVAAAWVNSSPRSSISGLIAEDVAGANPGLVGQTDKSIVKIEASSDCTVLNVTGIFSSGGITYPSGNSVALTVKNSDRLNVDCFVTPVSPVQAVNIDATSDFTTILTGFRSGGVIVDLNSTTRYPVRFESGTIENEVAGTFSFGINIGGARIGRISMVAQQSEAGSNSSISVGRIGNTDQFAAATGAPAAEGSRTIMSIADPVYASSYDILQGFCDGAATFGRTTVLVEGIYTP